MLRPRLRNILFKLALVVMSTALAGMGVLGWAESARAFDAYVGQSWAALDPLWPVYALAGIACIAAQILAACAVVNFARLAQASLVWRGLALAFYVVAVFFAAYSADKGAQVVLGSAHRAAYEANQAERSRLQTEIVALTEAMERARALLPADGATIPARRQEAAVAAFEAATSVERARLPQAQAELAALPLAPREAPLPWQTAILVYLIFLAWAVLEPWGYALAERGREPLAGQVAEVVSLPKRATHNASPGFFARLAAALGLWLLPQSVAAAPQPAPPEPIEISAWQDAKAIAFSMRGRFDVPEIAAKVGRDKSTVYRWFRERDRAAA